MLIRKSAIHLSLSGLIVVASACHADRKPRLDASVNPVGADAGVRTCEFGASEAGTCNGATTLDVDFCDRAWVEVTPEPGVFGEDVLVHARAKDPERNGLNVVWMAEPDGQFADHESASTTFRCESLGRKMLHMISVDNRGCGSDVELEINCVPRPTK